MSPPSRAFSLVAAWGALAVACGARTGLELDDVAASTSDAGRTRHPDEGGDAADAARGADGADGSGDAAPRCVAREIPIQLDAPNLYFVLDHSTSMVAMSKWANVRQVVAQLMTQVGPGARFGAAMYPGVGGRNSCTAGVEVMSLRQGDAAGTAASAFLAATGAPPDGATPTAATLEALAPALATLPGSTFVVLATDGGPNCNAALSCAVEECTPNVDSVPGCQPGGPPNCCDPSSVNGLGCLDGASAAQAAADLKGAGVPTFVLGIPGSAPYADVLDAIAVAGGTARPDEPRYYRVDSADTAALSAALDPIAERAGAGCAFALPSIPTDRGSLGVSVSGSPSAGAGPDGWSLSGTTLTLLGATCKAARDAGAASVRVVGC